jgi:hypothetical protein
MKLTPERIRYDIFQSKRTDEKIWIISDIDFGIDEIWLEKLGTIKWFLDNLV